MAVQKSQKSKNKIKYKIISKLLKKITFKKNNLFNDYSKVKYKNEFKNKTSLLY